MKALIPGIPYNPNLFSPIAEIFCNAKAFVVFDCKEESFVSYDNLLYETPNTDIGEYLKKLKVDNVICNSICKSCFESIRAAGIQIWYDHSSSSMRESCMRFVLGQLKPLETPINFNMHMV